MRIRTLAAATATAAILLGTGTASADETSATANVPAGERACIELDSADPVRAEGVSDRGVRFTLTLDGEVVAVSAGDAVDFSADSDATTLYGVYSGTVRLCAENEGDGEAFVVLNLFSKDQASAGEAAPVAEPPAGDDQPSTDEQPPAEDDPSTLEDLIENLVEHVVEHVEALVEHLEADLRA